MKNYATMEDGKWQDGELDKEQRGKNYISRFPAYEKFDFISEGDSPSFFYILNTGLRSYENPTWGGWAGRFGNFQGKLAVNDVADYNPKTKKFETAYAIKREKLALQDVKGKIVDFPTMEFTLNHVRELLQNEKIDVIKLNGANSQKVSFTVPADAKVGDTIHIILEVQDNGKHNLKHYQRVVVTVK